MKSYQDPCNVCGAPTSHRSGVCKDHRLIKCEHWACKVKIEPTEKRCKYHKRIKGDVKTPSNVETP